ncbi:MAG: hypothetical protein WCG10_04265 [Chlamydiota bacterium]
MSFEGRAFYNLLRMQEAETSVVVKPWQALDYREVKENELFHSLEQLDVFLTPKTYKSYAQTCSSPEELAQIILGEEADAERREKVYLLLFEMWRRFCKDEQSLSIFCDELDYQIDQHDRGVENDEILQELLDELENILDQTADHGEDPQKVFELVAALIAHNIESFIYTFASEQVDKGNDVYASELVDGFYEYFDEKMWLDFLKVRFVAMADPKEAIVMLELLLEKIQEVPDLDLCFEILYYLIYQEDIPLFYTVLKKTEALLEKEEDFQDLLEIVVEYLSTLDKEVEEDKIRALLKKRMHLEKEKAFDLKDNDMKELNKVLRLTAL